MPALSISTHDLKKSVLRHSGEVDDGTSYYDKNGWVMDYLNKAHVSILGGGNEFDFELSKPWSWAVIKDPLVFVLQIPYITGSVTATNGLTAITFNPAPPTSLTGGLLQVSDRPDYMRIVTHSAGSTSAIIDGPYADATATTGFRVIFIDYKLPTPANGILRLTQQMVVFRPQDLQGDEEQQLNYIDQAQMARDYPVRRIIDGNPNFFTITSKDPNGNYFIRVEKSAQLQTRVEFKCIGIPSPLVDVTNNFPLMPLEHRDCLDFAASYFLCLDKNDDRAQMYFQLTQQKLKAMQKAEEKQKTQISKNRGKLLARGDQYNRGKRFITQETT